MNIVIVDFEDSFTYNILGELKQIGFSSRVIHWSELTDDTDFDLLILGPGPGHPHDYAPIFPLLKKLISEKRKILGICLGHQILWNIRDALVVRSKYPAHGERQVLELNSFFQKFFQQKQLVIQRYNSLAVLEHSILSDAKFCSFDNEVMLSFENNIIGMQFHPESLGTTHRKQIFLSLMGHYTAS